MILGLKGLITSVVEELKVGIALLAAHPVVRLGRGDGWRDDVRNTEINNVSQYGFMPPNDRNQFLSANLALFWLLLVNHITGKRSPEMDMARIDGISSPAF